MLVVSRGLQNRCGGLGTSQVGSIPTYSRQKIAAELQRLFFVAQTDIVSWLLTNRYFFINIELLT